MSSNREQVDHITQRGRDLLTLIRDAGSDGIMRKGLTDALTEELDNEDFTQLELLEAQGFITVERVDIVEHSDVEYLYRMGSRHD
jgi:hypothetical protein